VFAFRTKKDCAMWVKQSRLETHSDAMPCHIAIRQDRHLAKRTSRGPLPLSSLCSTNRHQQKASQSPTGCTQETIGEQSVDIVPAKHRYAYRSYHSAFKPEEAFRTALPVFMMSLRAAASRAPSLRHKARPMLSQPLQSFPALRATIHDLREK
jgi:hypothetical protein